MRFAFFLQQALSAGAHLPSTTSAFPLHLAHLALLQQQQPTATALLAQQQVVQQQYLALLQQQQHLNVANALQAGIAAQSNRSLSCNNDIIEQQQNSGGNRKRGARVAGLDQQHNSSGASVLKLVQNVSDNSGCSSSTISGQQQHLQLLAAAPSVFIVGIHS
jgi:hypothetical protein